MTRPSRPQAASPARLFATALLFGVGWYGVELLLLAFAAESDGPRELARGALRFLPWQLAAFAILGAGVAALGALRPLSAAAGGWLLLFAGAVLFLGVRVAEGALHKSTLAGAVVDCTLLAGGLAVAVALLAALGRVLPQRLRAIWPFACWAGCTVLLIGFLQRAGALLALGELSFSEVFAQLTPSQLALAGAVGCAPLVAAHLRGSGTAALAFLVAASGLTGALARGETRRLPDVYVFLLDTLRHDHLGPQADGTRPTPALDRIAPEFIRFRNAFSPSTRTSRAMPGIMTSLSVRVVGSSLSPEATTLAERLRQAGLATLGLSANPQVSPAFGYGQGFDVLSMGGNALDFQIVSVLKLAGAAFPGAAYELGVLGAELFYPPIAQLRQRALRLLDASPGPSLLYVQTMDVHGPYLPPRRLLPDDYRRENFLSYHQFLRLSGTPALRDPSLEPQLENLRQRYAAGARHTDEVLAAWIEELRARGRWDEALVWIVSDHGEAFGEHGVAGHGQSYLGNPVVQVPLWVKPPRSLGLEPREIESPVSTFDLLPTTLGLLGLPPVEPAFGLDLTPQLGGQAADPERVVIIETDDGPRASRYAAVRWPWKLALRFGPEDVAEQRTLYDLERDPAESNDLIATRPAIADELEAAIQARRRAERELAYGARGPRVDPETRERLRSLGYVD
jgi:arylsulfatase